MATRQWVHICFKNFKSVKVLINTLHENSFFQTSFHICLFKDTFSENAEQHTFNVYSIYFECVCMCGCKIEFFKNTDPHTWQE